MWLAPLLRACSHGVFDALIVASSCSDRRRLGRHGRRLRLVPPLVVARIAGEALWLNVLMLALPAVLLLLIALAFPSRSFDDASPAPSCRPARCWPLACCWVWAWGGFVDGIVFHQVLQWHNMRSARLPPDNLLDTKIKMFWDGLFHAGVADDGAGHSDAVPRRPAR
jgi:hypothetical protein